MYIYNYIWNIYIYTTKYKNVYIYIQYPWIQLGLSFLTVDSWLCETPASPPPSASKSRKKVQASQMSRPRDWKYSWTCSRLEPGYPTNKSCENYSMVRWRMHVTKMSKTDKVPNMKVRCNCPGYIPAVLSLTNTQTSEFAYKIFMMRLMTVVFGHFLAMWLCSSPCHVCS